MFRGHHYARKPDTQPTAPHHTDNLKTKHQRPQAATNCINTLELLMMGIMVPPKHVEQAVRSAIKTSVASSWHFYFHILTTMHGQNHFIFMMNKFDYGMRNIPHASVADQIRITKVK
jgi:hypothetical protein